MEDKFDPFGSEPAVLAIWAIFGAWLVFRLLGRLVLRFLHQRELYRTIRHAIDAGQELDPALLDRLMASAQGRDAGPSARPASVIYYGVILISGGVGCVVLAFFPRWPQPIMGLIGSGILIAVIGLGLLVYACWLIRATNKDGTSSP